MIALAVVVLLPLISPPFTAAIALIFALGPRGLVSYHLFGIAGLNIYGLGGTALSETLTYFPIAYLTLKGVLANVDATLEDSALSLGARRWRVFRTVTVPLAAPGLANSFLLLSAASLADASRLAYPSAVLFVALGAIYLFAMSVSVSLTRQHRASVRLNQELALLRRRLDEQKEAGA